MSWCEDLPADMKTFVVNHLKVEDFCPFFPICNSWIPQFLSFPVLGTSQHPGLCHPALPSFPASRFSLSLITECWALAQLCLFGELDKFPASKPHPSLASHPFFDSSFTLPTSQLSSCSLLPSWPCPLGARTLLCPNAIFYTQFLQPTKKSDISK